MPPLPKDNLTAVLYGINDLRLVSVLEIKINKCLNEDYFFKEQRPIPKPKDDRKCFILLQKTA